MRLYHFGKGSWGFGFWFLVGFFSGKVYTIVLIGSGSIGSTVSTVGAVGFITGVFGVGIGDDASRVVGGAWIRV